MLKTRINITVHNLLATYLCLTKCFQSFVFMISEKFALLRLLNSFICVRCGCWQSADGCSSQSNHIPLFPVPRAVFCFNESDSILATLSLVFDHTWWTAKNWGEICQIQEKEHNEYVIILWIIKDFALMFYLMPNTHYILRMIDSTPHNGTFQGITCMH